MSSNQFYNKFLSLTEKVYPVIPIKSNNSKSDYYKNVLESLPCIAMVFNHEFYGFEYISNGFRNILGYNPADFVGKESMKNVVDSIHPDHLPIFAEHIWTKMLDCFSKNLEDGMNLKYRFVNSFKINKLDGAAIWVLHQFTPVELDSQGMPIRSVITMHDISGIKKDNVVDLLISKMNDEQVYIHVSYFSFESESKFKHLTAREIEILGLLNKGFSTKEIGEKLFISNHTVANHRKNMLNKIDAKNTNELIYYYRQRGIL